MKHNYTGRAEKKNSADFDQTGRQFSLLIPFLILRDLYALMFPVTGPRFFSAFSIIYGNVFDMSLIPPPLFERSCRSNL